MKNTKTKFHFPLPILVGEGKLILDAATAHPEVAGRLDKTYLADTATVLGNVKTQATDQKQKRGQTGVLSKAQLDKIHAFQLLIHNAKETAKLAFKGQTVKLRAAFQVGVHKPHDLQSQLQRGRTVLASMQAAENVRGAHEPKAGRRTKPRRWTRPSRIWRTTRHCWKPQRTRASARPARRTCRRTICMTGC